MLHLNHCSVIFPTLFSPTLLTDLWEAAVAGENLVRVNNVYYPNLPLLVPVISVPHSDPGIMFTSVQTGQTFSGWALDPLWRSRFAEPAGVGPASRHTGLPSGLAEELHGVWGPGVWPAEGCELRDSSRESGLADGELGIMVGHGACCTIFVVDFFLRFFWLSGSWGCRVEWKRCF